MSQPQTDVRRLKPIPGFPPAQSYAQYQFQLQQYAQQQAQLQAATKPQSHMKNNLMTSVRARWHRRAARR
jgi:hypothetical protein